MTLEDEDSRWKKQHTLHYTFNEVLALKRAEGIAKK